MIETEGLFYNELNDEITCVEGNVLKPDTPVSRIFGVSTHQLVGSCKASGKSFLRRIVT